MLWRRGAADLSGPLDSPKMRTKKDAPAEPAHRLKTDSLARGVENDVSASGRALRAHTLLVEERLQFTGLEHLADDIASADELTLDIELWNGRPVGIFLDALPELVRSQDIDALVVDAEIIEDLDHLARE